MGDHKLITDIHGLGLEAVYAMFEMCKAHGSTPKELHERQLVHELGYLLKLKYDKQLWTAFEWSYPTDTRKRCDIVVWRGSGRRKGGRFGWIETKMTGLKSDGSWDNRFSSLNWEHDRDKLSKFDNRHLSATHEKYWVWLYLFETYRTEIKEFYSKKYTEFERLNKEDVEKIFRKGIEGKTKTLGSILIEMFDDVPKFKASLLPLWGKGEENNFSALLCTADFS